MIFRGLLMCCWMFAFTSVQSQDIEQPSPQAAKGIEAFKKKNYKLAASEFQNLLNKYPKDPLYHYYTGASLVLLNSDLSQGLELLKIASGKNVPLEVYYSLGLCYYRLYQPDNALPMFERFKEEASISQLKEYSVNQEIQRVKMAAPMLRTISVPEVVAKSTLPDSSALFSKLPNTMVSCSACPAFTNGCTRMLLPKTLRTGDYVYYAAYGNMKIRGKEIYRIRKTDNDSWSDSESVGMSINTMQDEDFPYFDSKKQILYFCSKGHLGFGGFDLFKSKYDSIKNTWSKPENMGFPMNTPFDDILYLRDEATGVTTLVSNRENESGSFTMYQLINDIIHEARDVSNSQDLINASRLPVNAKEKLSLQYARTASIKKTETKTETKNNTTVVQTIKKDDKPITNKAAPSKYIETLSKALRIQTECDSLLRIADAMRYQTSSIADDTERGKLQKQISVLELQAKDLQSTADKFYIEAREMELENKPVKTVLYQKPKDESDQTTVIIEPKTDPSLQFELLTTSPYSDKNPILIDVKLPDGILYKIQIATFSKTISQDLFGGIKPITGEKQPDGVSIKYYAGWFKTYNEVEPALRKIQENGYKQAFIVAYYNGQKLPVSRAKQIEKDE